MKSNVGENVMKMANINTGGRRGGGVVKPAKMA